MALLVPELRFTAKEYIGSPREQREAGKKMELVDYDCYTIDHKDRLITSYGFYDRITRLLTKAGYRVVMKDLTPHPHPEIFEPNWDRLFDPDIGIELREGQDQFLVNIFSHPCGRISCPPAYGKSLLIGLIAMCLPRARIDVVSKRVPVLRDRIWPELCGMLPDVGIVGGGKKRKDRRVMCYTVDSLGHSEGDADIMIGDECHEMASDKAAYMLSRYDRSRNYGFSASHDMRIDDKDMRVEAIFGPMIFEVSYQEAQAQGLVTPIEVHWTDVIMDTDPCEGEATTVARKQLGAWTNDYRNDLIAADANRYDKNTQTLITVETIEHAVNLKKRLPDFQIVHAENGMNERDRRWYIKNNLLRPSEPRMSLDRRMKLTKGFESGKIKKVICNTVWNVGVNFTGLEVLIRADAGGSPVNDVQIPGRASRLAGGKDVAIVHDYKDQFNRGFRQKACGRHRSYDKQGWKQISWGATVPTRDERHLWDL